MPRPPRILLVAPAGCVGSGSGVRAAGSSSLLLLLAPLASASCLWLAPRGRRRRSGPSSSPGLLALARRRGRHPCRPRGVCGGLPAAALFQSFPRARSRPAMSLAHAVAIPGVSAAAVAAAGGGVLPPGAAAGRCMLAAPVSRGEPPSRKSRPLRVLRTPRDFPAVAASRPLTLALGGRVYPPRCGPFV